MMQYAPSGLNQLSIPTTLPLDWRYVQEKSDVHKDVPEDIKKLEQMNKDMKASNSTSTQLAQMFPGEMPMMFGGMTPQQMMQMQMYEQMAAYQQQMMMMQQAMMMGGYQMPMQPNMMQMQQMQGMQNMAM